MGRELGGREGQANESTHLSIFLFGDTFTFSNGTCLFVSVFIASIGLTKDRERSETVACARTYTYQQ